MSKKFEAIKQAVFYAHETPEKLAGILEGLVEDVFTGVVFKDGPSEVKIPESANATATYVAKAVSQFGDEMTNSVTYTLKAEHTGATITTEGVLTVASTTKAGTITIVATSGAKTAEMEVQLVA